LNFKIYFDNTEIIIIGSTDRLTADREKQTPTLIFELENWHFSGWL